MKQRRVRSVCHVPKCFSYVHGRGLCIKHYMRHRRNSHPITHPRRAVREAPFRPSHVAVLTVMADGESRFLEELAEQSGYTERTVQMALSAIRLKFGYDTIITDYNPTRYRLAEKLPVKRWAATTALV